MAQSELSRQIGGGGTQRPQFSIYTMMLVLSLIAVTTACVLLWMELSSYGPWPQWRAG